MKITIEIFTKAESYHAILAEGEKIFSMAGSENLITLMDKIKAKVLMYQEYNEEMTAK